MDNHRINQAGASIPRFSDYTIDIDSATGEYGVRDYHRTYGRWVAGSFMRPGSAMSLYSDFGERVTKTLSTWVAMSGVDISRAGHPIPGFPDYTLDRRPDGTWGVRSYVQGSRGVGTGGRKVGDFLIGKRTVKLRDASGEWVGFKIKRLVALAGAVPVVGLEIPGFPDYRLDVDETGRWGIRSYKCVQGANIDYGAFLKPYLDERERRTYALSDPEGRIIPRQLAHFVLLATVGPPPSDLENIARHLDDDCTNDDPSNLAWGTQRDNAADRMANGRTAAGERNGMATLTEAEARSIFVAYHSTNVTQASLAERYGVNQSAISAIAQRKTWRAATEDLADMPRRRARRDRGLSNEARALIAKRHASGESTTHLADEFGVTLGAIRNAVLSQMI